jgi:hypothetical protein
MKDETCALAGYILTATTLNKGCTVLKNGTVPVVGYAVGGAVSNQVIIPAEQLDGTVIRQFIERYELFTGVDGFGTWENEGFVYIDCISLLQDENEAITKGRARGEQAIWVLHEQREITL